MSEILWMNNNDGTCITSVKFNNEAACEKASKYFQDSHPAVNHAVCIQDTK